MQHFVDTQLVLNRDENHFKMTMFLKASVCDGQKHYPGMKWTFDWVPRESVDEILVDEEH